MLGAWCSLYITVYFYFHANVFPCVISNVFTVCVNNNFSIYGTANQLFLHYTKDNRFPDHHQGKLKWDRNVVESSSKH